MTGKYFHYEIGGRMCWRCWMSAVFTRLFGKSIDKTIIERLTAELNHIEEDVENDIRRTIKWNTKSTR